MIAIGILGVGMLMVAATFPVGLDQSRIVSEESYAPVAANEAFARIELLLTEPISAKRVGFGMPPATDSILRTFREALSDDVALPPNGPLEFRLSNGRPNEWVGVNELFAAPYALADGTIIGGLQTRYYPSVPAALDATGRWRLPKVNTASGAPVTEYLEPPYNWSVLFRKVRPLGSTSTSIQFVVFVNRRSGDVPRPGQAPASGVVGPVVMLPFNQPGDRGTVVARVSDFNEGGWIVGADGAIYRIKQIDRTANQGAGQLILDRNPTGDVFWFVLADQATGRSPCFAVYSRMLPL